MSRNTKGRIFTRGKYNRYYLQYYLNGKEIRVALKDLQGKPVQNMKEAEKARDRIMKTVAESDELERWRNVADKIASTETRLEESRRNAEEAEAMSVNSRATVENGFSLLLECEHRPRSLRRLRKGDPVPRDTTVYNNHAYYRHFADWLVQRNVSNLSQVTHGLAFEFITFLKESLSSNTVNKHLNFLKSMFEALIKDKRLVCENPFSDMEREEEDETYSKKPLPFEKVLELFNRTSGELRVLFFLGYYTGLRRGDCATLKWEEVHFDRNVIERSPNKIRKRTREKVTVKVGIPEELRKELETLPRKGEYVLPKMADLYQPRKRSILTRMIKEAFESCGIRTTEVVDGKPRNVYGFHSLRYSYGSHHAEIGTPQPVIQKNMGHSSPVMTEHYERISDEAAVRFANAFSSSGSPRRKLHELIDRMDDMEVEELLKKLSVRKDV